MWGHRVLQGNSGIKMCCVRGAVGKSVGPGALQGVCSASEQRDGLHLCCGEGRPEGPCSLLPLPHPCPSVLLQLPGRALVQLR